MGVRKRHAGKSICQFLSCSLVQPPQAGLRSGWPVQPYGPVVASGRGGRGEAIDSTPADKPRRMRALPTTANLAHLALQTTYSGGGVLAGIWSLAGMCTTRSINEWG